MIFFIFLLKVIFACRDMIALYGKMFAFFLSFPF